MPPPAAFPPRLVAMLALAALGAGLLAPPAEAARPAPWRPHWWPAWLPAGNGQPTILIRLRRSHLYVHDGYRGWTHFPAATGKDYATPRGYYKIVSKVRYPAWHYKDQHVPGGSWDNPLGVAWLGLGMPPGWGRHPIGIHGTNAPWSIGRRVSKGCIRLANRDVLQLYRMVPIGCPVVIRY